MQYLKMYVLACAFILITLEKYIKLSIGAINGTVVTTDQFGVRSVRKKKKTVIETEFTYLRIRLYFSFHGELFKGFISRKLF